MTAITSPPHTSSTLYDLIIVGAGAQGLYSAYYAGQKGLKTLVVDQGEGPATGCSHGNAGYITPSHFTPLANLENLKKGLKFLLTGKGPLKFNFSSPLELARFATKFAGFALGGQNKIFEECLLALSLESDRLFRQFCQKHSGYFHQTDGLLVVANRQSTLDSELALAERGLELGLDIDILKADQACEKLAPVTCKAKGAILYKDDSMIDPGAHLEALARHLEAESLVDFSYASVVTQFQTENQAGAPTLQGVHLYDKKLKTVELVHAKNVVLAAGAGTKVLGSLLNIPMDLLPGKGYSMTIPHEELAPLLRLPLPTLLPDPHVAFSPLPQGLRLAGTMELGRSDPLLDQARMMSIAEGAAEVLPDFAFLKNFSFTHGSHKQAQNLQQKIRVWAGARPCTPSGIPLVGRSAAFDNLFLATGHGMLGVSLAPVTGKILVDLALGGKGSCGKVRAEHLALMAKLQPKTLVY